MVRYSTFETIEEPELNPSSKLNIEEITNTANAALRFRGKRYKKRQLCKVFRLVNKNMSIVDHIKWIPSVF